MHVFDLKLCEMLEKSKGKSFTVLFVQKKFIRLELRWCLYSSGLIIARVRYLKNVSMEKNWLFYISLES